MDREHNAQKFRIPEGKDLLEDVRIDGSIILKWTLKQVLGVRTRFNRFNWLRLGTRGFFLFFFVNMEIDPEVSKVVNFLTGWSTAGFIRRILFHSMKQFVHILCY